MLRDWLHTTGHQCQHHVTCAAFARAIRRETFDLLIIDWLLPDGSGLDVLRDVRGYLDWPIPVLFVTSRAREDDIVQALQAGADDYMIKPVRQRELLARVQALGRRGMAGSASLEVFIVGPYRIDMQHRQIARDGIMVTLTDKEFDLACFLFRNRDRLLSRAHLLDAVWGINTEISTRTLDTHISSIRKKLDIRPEQGFQIKTVYRHGYRFDTPGG